MGGRGEDNLLKPLKGFRLLTGLMLALLGEWNCGELLTMWQYTV